MKNEKINQVTFNNRKKLLVVRYLNGKIIRVHYGMVGIRKNLREVEVDKETRGRSVVLKYRDGTVDYMPYDQPLAVVRDPQYILQNQIEVLISQIAVALKKKRIAKKYLAHRLGTSESQIRRLLDSRHPNKNLSQLYDLATAVGLGIELSVRKAA